MRSCFLLKKMYLISHTNAGDLGNFDALYTTCLRRFFYIRCYDSFEFLATLKVNFFLFKTKLAFFMHFIHIPFFKKQIPLINEITKRSKASIYKPKKLLKLYVKRLNLT